MAGVGLASLLLAGCAGSSPAPSSSATDLPAAAEAACVEEGTNSAALDVSTNLKKKPTVKFDKPLSTEATEKSVIVEGDGEEIALGDSVIMSYALFNATSGDELDAGGYGDVDPLTITIDPTQFLPGLMNSVACSTVGSRIVAIIPPADAFGTTGSTDLGVAADDSVIFVVDIEGTSPTAADGVQQDLVAGVPTVELAEDGTPTVTIPDADPPTELVIETLKKGDGEEVAEGATVSVQYQGVLWRTGEVFDQSWGSGPTSFSTDQVIAGFGKALVGQTVGSQVIAVIPPDEGYGEEGQADAGIEGTDTLVFVVDILAVS